METPLYQLLGAPRPVAELPGWETAAEASTQVVGWTCVGDFLLRDPIAGNYAVLRTRGPRIVQVIYTERDEFLREFVVPSIDTKRVAALAARLGRPGHDEVFADAANPPWGDAPVEAYEKENAWAYVARAAAVYGLGRGDAVDTVLIQLRPGDDFWFWRAALDHILAEVPVSSAGAVVEVGRCSHWLRPHQTRWTADGGFAWPTGYGSGTGGESRSALPQFDWSVAIARDGDRWTRAADKSARPAVRVALPSRTRRHDQAAVHTLWTTGREKDARFFGFRRRDGAWACTAETEPREEREFDRRAREDRNGRSRRPVR